MAAPTPVGTPLPATITEATHILNTSDANNGFRAPDVLLGSGDNSALITLANPLPIVLVGGTPAAAVLHRGVSGGSGVPTAPTVSVGGTGGTLNGTYYWAVAAYFTGGGMSLPSASSAGTGVSTGQVATVSWTAGTVVPPPNQSIFAWIVCRATTASQADPTQWAFVISEPVATLSFGDGGAVPATVAALNTADTSTYIGVGDASEPSGLSSHDATLIASVPSGAVGGPGTSWIDWDVSVIAGGNAATCAFMPRKWNARQSLWFNSVLAADAAALTVTATANTVTRQTLRVQTQGFWYYLRCISTAGLGAGFRADAATS